jgi:hypothetical protein
MDDWKAENDLEEAIVTCLLGETEENCENLGMSGISVEIANWALTEHVSRTLAMCIPVE